MGNQLLRPLFPRAGNIIFEWLCIAIVYSLFFWTAGNSVVLILLAAYWLLFQKKFFDLNTDRTRLMLLFCSLYLVSLVGLIYTSNLSDGLFRLQQKSALLFLPLIFGTVLLPQKTYKIIRIHFVIATCLACLISLIYGLVKFYETGVAEMISREALTIFPDLNPPMTGILCLLAVIILLHDYNNNDRKWTIPVVSVVVFLSGYTILLGVRLVIFCLFLILLIFIFRYISSLFFRVLLGGIFIFVTVLSFIFIPGLNRKWREAFDFSAQNTIELDKDASLGRPWGGKSIRFAIWECSGDILKKHWLTGVGTGDVQDSLQAAYANRKFYFAAFHNKYNAHNQYLEMWLANGLAGILIFILCLAVPLVMHIRQASAMDYSLFLCLILVMSITESFLNVNKGTIMYSLFNSIFGFAYLAPATWSVNTNKTSA
ncbi:MAG TPA: O-antigen ligase family protein [Chitinophagaceae bacterium]|nr:O-antigen ligase family protein [Chitinophagaceae bacterium]